MQFKHVEHELVEGQTLQSVYIDIPKIPKLKQQFGGPNYVSMGEEVDFFFESNSSRRRLEGEEAAEAPAVSAGSDSATTSQD